MTKRQSTKKGKTDEMTKKEKDFQDADLTVAGVKDATEKAEASKQRTIITGNDVVKQLRKKGFEI